MDLLPDVARLENVTGAFPALIICEHASNDSPSAMSKLGLAEDVLETHVAWDPGALVVAKRLSLKLGAPLLHATVSRLVIDLNRNPSAIDSIVTSSEGAVIPGNAALDDAERRRRVRDIYEPFHQCVDEFLSGRKAIKAVISVHSFTPVLRGKHRPWHLGFIYDVDDRLAKSVAAALARDTALIIGMNEPYNPSNGVYHTLDRHTSGRGFAPLMIEIRNDLIRDPNSQDAMATRLAPLLADAVSAL